MARTIYIRVSTEAQSYARQLYKMNEYFTRMGISMDGVEIISEKITSYTEFTERKIYPVLQNAKAEDIIYVCQLDRLGRTMVDILKLVDFAVKKGVILLTIDNGYQIENKTAMGKMYLGIVSAMAEAERELRAERCLAGLEAAKNEIKEYGYRISRSGRAHTHLGNEKGYDMSKQVQASAKARAEAVIKWKEQSPAYKRAIFLYLKGKSRKEILEDLDELYNVHGAIYGTPQGCRVTKSTLSRWINGANLLNIA